MLTRRGKVVLTIALLIALYALVWLSTRIWWTETGYCFDSYATCYYGEVK